MKNYDPEQGETKTPTTVIRPKTPIKDIPDEVHQIIFKQFHTSIKAAKKEGKRAVIIFRWQAGPRQKWNYEFGLLYKTDYPLIFIEKNPDYHITEWFDIHQIDMTVRKPRILWMTPEEFMALESSTVGYFPSTVPRRAHDGPRKLLMGQAPLYISSAGEKGIEGKGKEKK